MTYQEGEAMQPTAPIEFQRQEGKPLFTKLMVLEIGKIIGGDFSFKSSPGYSEFRLSEPGKFVLGLYNLTETARRKPNTANLVLIKAAEADFPLTEVDDIQRVIVTPGDHVDFIWMDSHRTNRLSLYPGARAFFSSRLNEA